LAAEPAGYAGAIAQASSGKIASSNSSAPAALAELGLHPSKTLLKSAELLQSIRKSRDVRAQGGRGI